MTISVYSFVVLETADAFLVKCEGGVRVQAKTIGKTHVMSVLEMEV
jgi:hypothetical protein